MACGLSLYGQSTTAPTQVSPLDIKVVLYAWTHARIVGCTGTGGVKERMEGASLDCCVLNFFQSASPIPDLTVTVTTLTNCSLRPPKLLTSVPWPFQSPTLLPTLIPSLAPTQVMRHHDDH